MEEMNLGMMIENGEYTLSHVLNSLQRLGYTEDFNLPTSHPEFRKNPHLFKIDGIFRFDYQSDPDDQSILYAVSCQELGIKGVILNSYGIYSDPVISKILADLDTDYNKREAYSEHMNTRKKPPEKSLNFQK
ncbi:MAG: hypothetical protein A2622_14025 [Bdellovibrionales bacterium RIFCSPHIGHO2_01_FULL_40_29]|nr:MAG: hypothetical protein A2622_14025 [Bdellovibrionales bacterium RIFCSPHIGHO2_01_FULL_40_29]OFZ33638.1 MAG: hypothetical protein A3D17_11635 [Bdellovibrionales bacterium RIFCSPHIGHO2_02_FULL_40_15]